MALSAGSRVGPYEILSSLGAGGMGEVYRARDPRLGRDVAIKVLPAAWSADRERLQRFEQEARAAAALNHPNILAVYNIGEYDGSPYIVSELLEGDTLRERLESGALPVRKAIEYAVQVTRGLAAAHEKGIVHRDLKPENIFVTSDGRLKVLDFGLAKLTQPDAALVSASALPTTPPNTQAGMVLGTIGYMSPEQVRGVAADHRADIFAFGLVLYEMLSGRRAFQRETGAETMTAILKEDAPDLPLTDRHIPPALERIVDRCLEKSPATRFQSAADLGFALEALSTHSDSAVIAVADKSLTSVSRLRRYLPWAAALMFLATTIALVAVQFFSPSRSAPIVRFQVPPPPGGMFPGANNTPRMAMSPDGQYLAFTANLLDGKPEQLWIRTLDSLEARALANTEAPLNASEPVQQPFWSPDSRFIGFFADDRLKKVDIANGNVQTVAAIPGNTWGGTWNRDGTILVGSASTNGLVRVSADGGVISQVTTLDASRSESMHLWPQFLPDGRHFLYFALAESPENRAIYAGSVDSEERKLVFKSEYTAHFAPPDHLLFVRDGALMTQRFDVDALELEENPVQVAESVRVTDSGRLGIAVSHTGVLIYRPAIGSAQADSELVWFDRAGKRLGSVGTPSRYRGVELSPDDRQIVVHREGGPDTGDLWMLDVQGGSAARFTFDASEHSMSPIWSADGRRILFSRQAGSAWSLYEKASSGVGSEQLLYGGKNSAASIVPLSVTPGGTGVVVRNVATSSDLSVVTLSGESRLSPYLDGPFNETLGRLSPDGRWMAYASNETGRNEIYVQSFPSPGTKYAVSMAGGLQPRWRRDGKELFFLAQPPGLVSAGPNTVTSVSVEAVGEGLKLGTPEPLFDSYAFTPTHTAPAFQYSVTSDGKRFLVARQLAAGDSAPGEEPLTVVLNWTSLLTRP